MAKKAFEGTVGTAKYLFDAKTGDQIAKIKEGEGRTKAAARLNLEVIPRKQANKEAVRKLINAWIAAKRPAMKTSKAKPKMKLKLASKKAAPSSN